jgi:hypothetical protein
MARCAWPQARISATVARQSVRTVRRLSAMIPSCPSGASLRVNHRIDVGFPPGAAAVEYGMAGRTGRPVGMCGGQTAL